MEILLSVAGKIAEYTVTPVGRQLGYLFFYKTNVDNLTNQMDDLKMAKERLQHHVNKATNNCQEIYKDVEKWLRSFDVVSSEAYTILNDDDHTKVVCSCQSFPHLLKRYQLSRKAKKMSIRVHDLLEDKEFGEVAKSPQIESSFDTGDYKIFDSRKEVLDHIMVAVRDANRSRIGLCGMGGIGKTMLANEIARQALEERLFSKVVVASISQTPELEKIQQHIADKLGLKFGETNNTMGERAKLLEKRLKLENKILFILDDVWDKLDLDVIGIHGKFKILLTSRSEDVLRNMSIAENGIFKIEALKFEEAINLFKNIIGDNKDNSLAHQIVEECGGLPICIATVAHALKYKNKLYNWEDALKQLQNSNFTGIDGMDKGVYTRIRLSYDFLEDDEAKSLLLLCALHEEDADIPVEYLMKYSRGGRLIRRVRTMKEARNRVNTLVDNLKSRCLLLDGRWKGYVKMHDVIRDVCLLIAKEKEMNNITNVEMYEDFVKDETNKECKALSFISYDDYHNLPPKLECPSLELLLMPSRSLESIPDDFFGQTRKLEALQMNVAFHILPSSFRSLENLQTLCLRGTSLEDITMIGELKSLKVLDLSRSRFIKLPKEIRQLQRLQLLDLRQCDGLKVIEPTVISNLTQMEELYLPKKFDGWETEEGYMVERRNASLKEIKSLQQLTLLHLYIPSKNVLPKGLFTEKLETYKIYIGDANVYDYVYSNSEASRWLYLDLEFGLESLFKRWLHLDLPQRSDIIAFGLESLIKRSEYLSLKRLRGVNNVAPCLDNDGFARLKHLELNQLISLERICQGNLPVGSFNELREVEVRNCDRLKNLFPLSVAKLLHEIKVKECENMEDIVSGHGREYESYDEALDNIIEFLELRCLELKSLPKLVHFYSAKQKTTGESSLVDYSKPLFNETVSLPNLEELFMKELNVVILWADPPPSSFDLQHLTRLELQSCKRIEYVFCFGMAERLVNLKELNVRYCESMKCIVKGSKTGEDTPLPHNTTFFPKLQTLWLTELPALKTLVSIGDDEGMIVFSNLKELNIEECDNLKYLLSFAMAQSLVQLEELKIMRCKNIEEVIASDEESGGSRSIIFEKLQTLCLQHLPNLEKFWEGDCIECPLLSDLVIEDCPKALEFISSNSMGKKDCPLSEEMGMVASASKRSFFKDKIIFPNLKELTVITYRTCTEQRLFNEKVIFPNLQKLKTYWCEGIFEMSSECYSTISSFPNLCELDVTYSSPKKSIALSDVILFLHKHHNIHTLRLEGSSFVDGHQQPQPAHNELSNTTTSTSLMHLDISNADGLTHPFEGPSLSIVVRNLKSLSIKNCSILQNIPPSFMIFHKLESLDISGCDRLTYLLGTSTAASLLQLKELKISHCKGMGVIISDDEQAQPEPHTQLVFHTLHKLTLHELPNLKSFYSGHKVDGVNHLFEGPSLSIVVRNLKSLSIEYCSRLQSIASSFMAFHKLETLRIWGCHRLTCLLGTSTAASLPQLKEMEIFHCNEMRVVISDDEQAQPEPHTQLVFHTLHTLRLEYLPNLKSFYSGDKDMSFPNLKELQLTVCPKMERFSHKLTSTSASFNKITVNKKDVEIREGDVNKTLTKLWEDNSTKGDDDE